MKQFLQALETVPDSITFNATIAVIDAHYDFTPTAFRNGEVADKTKLLPR